jgi:predicted LPLAT superfamily acyltransferase
MIEEGREPVDQLLAEGRGVVLVTAHLGNADVAAAVLAGEKVGIRAVRHDAERPEIRALFERVGAGRMPEVIDVNAAGRVTIRILGALREGCVVGMMGDRVVDGHWIECPFLGHPAPFPAGPFLVAAAARVPLVASFCVKEGVGSYRVVTLPPRTLVFEEGRPREEQVAEWVGWFAGELERLVRRHPFQWFNFFSFWEQEGLPPRVSADRIRSLPR